MQVFQYHRDEIHSKEIKDAAALKDKISPEHNHWLNLFEPPGKEGTKQLIDIFQLDRFLLSLITEPETRTKFIELENCILFTCKSIHFYQGTKIGFEKIIFVLAPRVLWSIQEKVGDHFDAVRERLFSQQNIILQRGTDFLFYLLLSAIVDNYDETLEELEDRFEKQRIDDWREIDPESLGAIEKQKKMLLSIRKPLFNLKEAITQMVINVDDEIYPDFSNKYFQEIKEQCGYLIDRIDSELVKLESETNLFFSLQSHRLNEVMKTLTIFSVIFIPLTFIAGIYGMNFNHMPELNFQWSYYIVLTVMVIMAVTILTIFKRKKWF